MVQDGVVHHGRAGGWEGDVKLGLGPVQRLPLALSLHCGLLLELCQPSSLLLNDLLTCGVNGESNESAYRRQYSGGTHLYQECRETMSNRIPTNQEIRGTFAHLQTYARILRHTQWYLGSMYAHINPQVFYTHPHTLTRTHKRTHIGTQTYTSKLKHTCTRTHKPMRADTLVHTHHRPSASRQNILWNSHKQCGTKMQE